LGYFDACAWADYDNDGYLDLVITDSGAGRTFQFHNNGNGTFTRISSGPLATDVVYGIAALWADYDGDGYMDLLVINAATNSHNFLYHNNRDGAFTRITANAIATELWTSGANCGAWGDYDNCSRLDLFVTHALFDGTLVSNSLYHNNGNSNNWLEVKLVGTVANRSGIGAKVRAKATIGGNTFWQLREINNGGGWNIQTLVAHFGLGNATNVETLRIEWPSGTVQEIQNVATKQILTITEPSRLKAALSNGVPQFTLQGGRNLQYDIQTSTDLANWSLLNTLTITSLNGTALITDTNAPGSDRRFYRAVAH
jgi:hypothetical protein